MALNPLKVPRATIDLCLRPTCRSLMQLSGEDTVVHEWMQQEDHPEINMHD